MIAPAPSNITVKEFFDTVYRPIRLIDASAGTIVQHDVAIKMFSKFLGRESTLADITEENLSAFMAGIVARKLSPVTANSRTRQLITHWRFAKRKQFAVADGLEGFQFLKEPKRNPVAWLPEEMDRILESCKLCRGRIGGVPAENYWPALLLVLYDTGLRFAPAMEIQFSEIDLASRMLRVPAERMKNNCEQYFRLSDHALQAISDASTPSREKLFPWPFKHHRSLYGRWRVILKRAGLPTTRKDMFHKIRRTTASQITMLAGEFAAVQQLGHRHASTIKKYVDPRFTANYDSARMLPRPGNSLGVVPELPAGLLEPQPVEKAPLPGLSRGMVDSVIHPARGTLERVAAKKSSLTAMDVESILRTLKMKPGEFAREIGVTPIHLARALTAGGKLPRALDSRVRVALGISGRNGCCQTDRFGLWKPSENEMMAIPLSDSDFE